MGYTEMKLEELIAYGSKEAIIENLKDAGSVRKRLIAALPVWIPGKNRLTVLIILCFKSDGVLFNLRYPFWHDHGLTIRHSELTENCRAALWYSDGLTRINCKIIGTQPLCYCKNLKLMNCEMLETDLAFEKSQVEATIATKVDSIKNPLSGRIIVPDVGEIILDDPKAKGEIAIARQNRRIHEQNSLIFGRSSRYMSKNILVISTSPRKGGNSETLADAVGAIQGNPALKEAYEMGTKV